MFNLFWEIYWEYTCSFYDPQIGKYKQLQCKMFAVSKKWGNQTHDGSMVLVYMLTWLGYIDGIHVTIYSSTMDPSWEMLVVSTFHDVLPFSHDFPCYYGHTQVFRPCAGTPGKELRLIVQDLNYTKGKEALKTIGIQPVWGVDWDRSRNSVMIYHIVYVKMYTYIQKYGLTW